MLMQLLDLDAIDYVEEDGVFYKQAVGSWGLDRVDQRSGMDNNYNPPSNAGFRLACRSTLCHYVA